MGSCVGPTKLQARRRMGSRTGEKCKGAGVFPHDADRWYIMWFDQNLRLKLRNCLLCGFSLGPRIVYTPQRLGRSADVSNYEVTDVKLHTLLLIQHALHHVTIGETCLIRLAKARDCFDESVELMLSD